MERRSATMITPNLAYPSIPRHHMSMKITEDARKYAAEQDVSGEDALKR